MADINDLRNKITEVGTAVDAAADRVIAHQAPPQDFQPEVDQLQAIKDKADTISPNP